MRLLIFSPVPSESTRGNQITALRWANMIRGLGHDVSVVDPHQFETTDVSRFDLLVALHARRSFGVVKKFHELAPENRIFVALTGTDLHVDLLGNSNGAADVISCLELADKVITLEPESRRLLRPDFQEKATVIFQSAEPVAHPIPQSTTDFVVTVIGHLRPVKDPFLTAEATQFLPPDSKIRVIHLGDALDDEMKTTAERLTKENSRYEWHGSVSHEEAQLQLAASDLTVLTSRMEGAPSVISEAVVNEVPILATRIYATIGLLGRDYPGLFPVGQANRLAVLLSLAETDASFYQELKSSVKALKPRFDPLREQEAWCELLEKDPGTE